MSNSDSKILRVLLVDDHLMTLEGIEKWLSHSGEFHVVGKASTAEAAISLATDLRPDLILLDLHLPGKASVRETLTRLRVITEGIVMLSGDDRASLVRRALKFGAAAYLLKDEPYDKICSTLRRVHQGEKQIVSERLKKVMRTLLTPAEESLSYLLAQGLKYEEIAAARKTSINTIRKQLTRMQLKLGLSSREALIAWSIASGFDVES